MILDNSCTKFFLTKKLHFMQTLVIKYFLCTMLTKREAATAFTGMITDDVPLASSSYVSSDSDASNFDQVMLKILSSLTDASDIHFNRFVEVSVKGGAGRINSILHNLKQSGSCNRKV